MSALNRVLIFSLIDPFSSLHALREMMGGGGFFSSFFSEVGFLYYFFFIVQIYYIFCMLFFRHNIICALTKHYKCI